MARVSLVNSLSVDRFASILGLNPVHFNQATASGLSPVIWPVNSNCGDIWFQHEWQANRVSREEIGYGILAAETAIETALGYFIKSKWVSQEVQPYPHFYRRNLYGNGLDVKGMNKSVILNQREFNTGGRRGTTLIETATTGGGTLVYSDEDSDGFFETATITVATTLTDACEIKLYFAGESAAESWEVRPVKRKSIAGGFVTIVCDSWLLINPALWEQFPSSNQDPTVIDVTTTANFVTSVDVYHEFNDHTIPSAQLIWGRNALAGGVGYASCPNCTNGCDICGLTIQDACISAKNGVMGEVVPVPATYNVSLSKWVLSSLAECREPDMVRLWYKSGALSNEFLSGTSCEELSPQLAQAVTWLAVTYITKEICSCAQAKLNIEHLQEDLALNSSNSSGSTSYMLPFEVSGNPFGTRRGAILAWKRVQQIKNARSGRMGIFAI